MELNHANKVLGIFMSILEDASESEKSSHLEIIIHYLKLLNSDHHEKLFVYLREWNTNSKYSYPCHMILSALTTIKSSESLMNCKVLTESLDGFIAYSERHFQRINRLFESSYILEYVAGQISLLPLPDDVDEKDVITSKRKFDDDDDDDNDDNINMGKIFKAPPNKKRSKTK